MSKSWFDWSLGVDERSFLLNRHQFIRLGSAGITPFGPALELVPRPGSTHDHAFQAGCFKVFSIAELDSLAMNTDSRSRNQTVFEIHVRTSSANLHRVEVSNLQMTAREGTMFQVASNFNCLENSAAGVYADYGNFVTNLMYDSTQGPAATSGAAFSALIRAHACFWEPSTSSQLWGQTSTRTINLLGDEHLSPHFGVHNGKALVEPISADWRPDQSDSLRSRVRVGLHCNVRPFFRRMSPALPLPSADEIQLKSCCFKQTDACIDQVFVSSINLNSPNSEPPAQLNDKVRFLLSAAYEGTYAAAVARGSAELVLTLIGGGSFANPLEDIAKAMAAAHVRYASRFKLNRVILPLFSPNANIEPFKQALSAVGVEARIVYV
jgi:hypothetical protein